MVILASVVFGMALPILPLHALYINLSTGVLLGVPLVFERREPDVMDRPPRDPRRPLLTHELFMRTGLVSLLLAAGAIGMFEVELARGQSAEAARTAAASVIVLGEVFYLFSARALLRPWHAVSLGSNLWLWAGIAAMFAVHAGFVYLPVINGAFRSAPLDGPAIAGATVVGILVLVVVEFEKWVRRRYGRADRSDTV